jgi:ATP-dependent Lon protease
VLPLKNTILFPGLLMPLVVGRVTSLAAVEAALATEDKQIVLFAQKDFNVETPGADDLYMLGTKAVVRKVNRQDDSVELLVLGSERVALIKLETTEPYLRAKIHPLPVPEDKGPGGAARRSG